jgi:hypothetical protein
MWGGPEAIELQHLLLLETLGVLKGLPQHTVRSAYDERLRKEVGQTNMPFFCHKKSEEEVAAFMKQVRADLAWF